MKTGVKTMTVLVLNRVRDLEKQEALKLTPFFLLILFFFLNSGLPAGKFSLKYTVTIMIALSRLTRTIPKPSASPGTELACAVGVERERAEGGR